MRDKSGTDLLRPACRLGFVPGLTPALLRILARQVDYACTLPLRGQRIHADSPRSALARSFSKNRRPSYPRFKGDFDTDVVIVGGGLTGCACAWSFAMAGVKTILLEADAIGGGGDVRVGLADPRGFRRIVSGFDAGPRAPMRRA